MTEGKERKAVSDKDKEGKLKKERILSREEGKEKNSGHSSRSTEMLGRGQSGTCDWEVWECV